MKLFKAIIVALIVMVIPAKMTAQTYSVDYKNQKIEQVIKDLRKQTGKQFAYQKDVIAGVPNITCSYHNATLEQLLNRIFYEEAGLDYEIVKGTIVLRKAARNRPYFKKVITGVVTDENDEPLVGATVISKSNGNGTSTDLEGAFSLLVEGHDLQLEVSYLGMKTSLVRVPTKGNGFMMIRMQSDETILDEVLVTGYQNIKRENATGSYQLINAQKLDERHTNTIVENLEGQIPGLVSYNNGLNDGGESALTIRGTSSFQARTNPLVVVDGLPIEGSIETVNPYNIENITVLKDAAAAAIYGARASNGVIVITTKRAHQEKLEVDFNADLTVSERQKYDNYNWITASQMIDLERYNFNSMRDNDPNSFASLLSYYTTNRRAITPVTRMLTANYLGDLSSSDLESQLASMAQNDYRKEWQDLNLRSQIQQQYNLALRTRGKYLNSSIAINYKGDNLGAVNEHDNTISFSYNGDLDATKWLKLSFGTNVISQRTKQHIGGELYSMNFYQPYLSMYNADGTEAAMEGYIGLYEPALSNSEYGLKDAAYYPMQEMEMNFSRTRNTNIRTYANATATILPGWTASAYFQYEDVYQKTNSLTEANSYDMRYLYDIYTQLTTTMVEDYDYETDEIITVPQETIVHNIPDGGMLKTVTSEGAYYTFRAQTAYQKTFAKLHDIDLLAGFEFRESHLKTAANVLMGYDEQTQTNRNALVNFGNLTNQSGQASVLGANYTMYGAPDADSFATTDVLHRFYSVYFTGNYTYDHRYSLSASYRVDKTDLFGADPKFRGRPLWSVGASWNMQNEQFMKPYTWIDVLKLRASYGLTGNIDSSVSSYLTASLGNEYIYGNLGASLNTPPNDQLRWEKTASLNLGLDFSVLGNRLSGSLDYYHKKGTDLLTVTDLDPTTGWTKLTINNGEMTNNGLELQLNGRIVEAKTRNQLGVNASWNLAYNRNKVSKVYHTAATGYEYLNIYTLHEDYPVHSLFSYDFAGLASDKESNMQYVCWRDHNGEVHQSEIYSDDFSIDDAIYSGSLDPKFTSSFTPELTYAGFSLSAMFSFYGGHVMRANVDQWTTTGSLYGYDGGAIPASALDYWTSGDDTQYIANGYRGSSNVVGKYDVRYMNTNVVPADYLKLRNLVIGYNFDKNICRRLGMNSIRLRLQMNNLCTWVRNKYGIDPEANHPIYGTPQDKTPRSYTMSLSLNF